MQKTWRDYYQRERYNPELHFNHGKPYKLSELVYICKVYEVKPHGEIALEVGRTTGAVRKVVNKLKGNGQFDKYKNMNIEE